MNHGRECLGPPAHPPNNLRVNETSFPAPRSEPETNGAQHHQCFSSPEHFRGKAMQQDNGIKFQDLDQVLRTAQIRRSADLGLWIRQYIQNLGLARQQRATDRKHAIATQSGTKLLAH